MRRFAPAGSTLVPMRDALSASLADHAMSVISGAMFLIERNREFGCVQGGNVRSPEISNMFLNVFLLAPLSVVPQRQQLDLRVGRFHPEIQPDYVPSISRDLFM